METQVWGGLSVTRKCVACLVVIFTHTQTPRGFGVLVAKRKKAKQKELEQVIDSLLFPLLLCVSGVVRLPVLRSWFSSLHLLLIKPFVFPSLCSGIYLCRGLCNSVTTRVFFTQQPRKKEGARGQKKRKTP